MFQRKQNTGRKAQSNRKDRTRIPFAREEGAIIVTQPHPPQIHPQITHTQRLRFLCTTGGTQSVTAQMLLDSMLVATAATTAFDIFDVVKVKSIEMWCYAASATASTTVSVTFSGGLNAAAGDARTTADTSVGTALAHIHAKPSKLSAAGQYQGSSAFVMFELTACPVGTVIDVEVNFRNTDVSPVATNSSTVGAIPGQFYYRGLDGLPVAGTKFPAQAYRVM
jgi:hypothetical protein